jgi:PKHD-type hydroxylase
MQHQHYPIAPYSPPTEFFVIVPGVFSEEQIGQIIAHAQSQDFFAKSRNGGEGGTVKGSIGDGQVDEDVRKSDVLFLHINEGTEGLFEHVSQVIGRVNYDKFNMDLDLIEALQFTEYSDEGGHYGWHIDSHQGDSRTHHRKLSMTAMLTGPDEYEGGDLLINNQGNQDNPVAIRANKGDVIIFYSHLPHTVTPVTKGKRISLVSWFLGPKVR